MVCKTIQQNKKEMSNPNQSNLPAQDTLIALVMAGRITEAQILSRTFNLNYQHPILIEAGVSKGIEKTEAFLKKFVTVHPKMQELKNHVRILANVTDPVLICGPSGTGKELIANALHGSRLGPFVALNCAGMPEHLIESELFGHVAGAFTDARQAKTGLMRHAENGTLFLDEIGDLNINVQAKFLRALQQKVIRPVGAVEDLAINCRIVCATHWNLEKLIEEKRFRLDLYSRISTFQLNTLPLEERIDDIMAIVKAHPNFTPDVGLVFASVTNWLGKLPLNVRSLEAMIRRYVVLGIKP